MIHNPVDLSGYAGKTIVEARLVTDAATPAGTWDEYYGEIAISNADGTVLPIYDRAAAVSLSLSQGAGVSNATAYVSRSNTANDAKSSEVSATYYLSDQINSVRATLAAGGWPVSMDIYYPYGVEPVASGAPDHYKFSGKERDAESGNDDFGARYYSPVMGRFMSPDWSASPEPVPYAKLDNPQTLNLYAYAGNNPITGIDLDGHCGVGDANAGLTEGPDPSKEITATCKDQPASKKTDQQMAPAATVPLTLPPLAFPSFEGVASKLLGGFLDLLGDAAVPLVFLANPASTASESEDTIQQHRSLPVDGLPGSTVTLPKPDGSPKQVRRYRPDGMPETDVDHSTHHGSPNPHAHDWGRDANGKPTRGAPRPVTPNDPQPN